MKNLLVYVAGPMGKGDLHFNVCRGVEAGRKLMAAGIPVIVPHLTAFMGVSPLKPYARAEKTPNGTTVEDWYAMDLVIVRRCDSLLRLPGESVGADLEVAEAHLHGKPVFYTIEAVTEWASNKYPFQIGAA